jgi:hypothetical protein
MACSPASPRRRQIAAATKVVYTIQERLISLRLQDAGSGTYVVDGLALLPFKVVCTVRLEAPPEFSGLTAQEGARVDADSLAS